MKHIEIIAKLNTVLDEAYKNIDTLKNDKVQYEKALKEAEDFCINKENDDKTEIRRHRIERKNRTNSEENISLYVDNYGHIVQHLNSKLINDCNEKESLFVEKMITRKITFVYKTKEEDISKIINDIKNKISNLIQEALNMILNENEHFIDIIFEDKELSVKEFYYDVMNVAERYGFEIEKYMQKIKEYEYGSDFDRFNRVNDFLYEDEISDKLEKEEFYKKYKVLLYNKCFKDEIDRIYACKNNFNVKINPVHYEFTSYDENERVEMFNALAVALYSNNRLQNKKILRIKIDIMCSYVSNETLHLILNNSRGSFIFVEFEVDKNSRRWTVDEYYGRTYIRANEITDTIVDLKDDVQFAIYVDKYQDKVRDEIYDELGQLNIVRFDDRLIPDAAIEYVSNLAKEARIEVNEKLINEVLISKDDLTKKEAKDIFEDYKDDIIKNKYFPEYKNYYDNIGNVDNYIDPYDELMALPGLHNVKEIVNDILTFHKMNKYKKEHFIEYKNMENIQGRYNGNSIPMHMVFMGNPGTCKTTVAKMIAKIFKSRGIIKNDRTEMYGVNGKCYHLKNAFKYAYGGILFIDEAYSLGIYELTDLVALMEEYRNDVIVILAGYTDAMKGMMHKNEGLNSRIKYKVEFENYTEEELWDILKYQAKQNNMIVDDEVKEKVYPIFASNQCDIEMGNGRLVRNILDMAMMNQAKRFKDVDLNEMKPSINDLNKLTVEDFEVDFKAITGKNSPKEIGKVDPEIELNNMIGLTNIKNMIKKIVATSYMNKVRKEQFGEVENRNFIQAPMHLAFLGNPGTAKTTVARLVARILKKKGIIKKDNIVEVGRKDLVGQFVGHTAPQVRKQFEKAKGGVLFIDEAYSLVDDRRGSFGDEAINTIIAEMENHRDDVIVIFAGYTDKMKELISINEGLRSRISYVLEFEDYNDEELYKIFEKMVSDYGLIASKEAKEIVKKIINDITKGKDYGNGRFIRKLIENAKINMDYRLSQKQNGWTFEDLKMLEKIDFEDLESDEILNKKDGNIIGFAI